MKTALAFALLTCSTCFAQTSLEIKGVALGSDPAAWLSRWPGASCSKTPDQWKEVSDSHCYISPTTYCHKDPRGMTACLDALAKEMTFAEKKVSSLYGYYVQDRLVRATAAMATSSYLPVVTALEERFGKPASRVEDSIKNRAGTAFERVTMIWNLEAGTITAKSRAGKIDEMEVEYLLKGAKEELAARAKALGKGAAKDL